MSTKKALEIVITEFCSNCKEKEPMCSLNCKLGQFWSYYCKRTPLNHLQIVPAKERVREKDRGKKE